MDTKKKKDIKEESEDPRAVSVEQEETANGEGQMADGSNEEVERLQTELEENKAKYVRALADYQNLEKRVREERIEWIRVAGKNILLQMLPVLDTLMMASKHSEDKNLLISIAQFLDALKSEGVTRIETKGKDFDPSIMECIQTVEGEEGKVIDEVRAGFMLHEKLLRVAEVTVGKANN